jgi:alpha-methylacyl-CoA racemase
MAEAPGHPHLACRGTFVEVDDHIQPAPAPRFKEF